MRDAAGGLPRAGALHARGRDLDHLQEGRPDPQDPPPDLRARLRDRRPHVGAARPHRQHRLRRPADPRPRLPRPAGDRARSPARAPIWCRRISGRRGSRRSARSPASTRSRTATATSPPHIFAVETGLSSDPPMNWRVSFLDRYRLASNSDAHSPGKLGREATTFDCDLDYFAIRRALETGHGYAGTVEFFPEEGKYHLDGHRKCEVRLSRRRRRCAHGGRCPVCGEPMTVGVEHRVEVLADRSEARRRRRRPPARCRTWCRCRRCSPRSRERRRQSQDGRPQLRPADRASSAPSLSILKRGAGRGHRPRRLAAARRGDHAPARRTGDPRRRLRRRVRRHPPVRGRAS